MYLDLLGSFGSRARVFCNLAPRRPSRDVPRFEAALKKANRLKSNELLGSFGFRARMFCNLALQRAITGPGGLKPALKKLTDGNRMNCWVRLGFAPVCSALWLCNAPARPSFEPALKKLTD
jgi:hypothetical protein